MSIPGDFEPPFRRTVPQIQPGGYHCSGQWIPGFQRNDSIALFDIPGFANFVENNGTQVILELYNKLFELIHRLESNYTGAGTFAESVVPVPVSNERKISQFVENVNGYIRVCHFSDIFLIYTNYLFQ